MTPKDYSNELIKIFSELIELNRSNSVIAAKATLNVTIDLIIENLKKENAHQSIIHYWDLLKKQINN